MKIEFVNHASVIIQQNEINLICDPWLEGPVFHDGWSLLCESKFTYGDFNRITHIWFSHEHPDHFFPPNIKNISEEHRSKIVVLYQDTSDKRVVGFLKRLGFKAVIELKPLTWYKLAPDFKLTCNPTGHDSWLCVKAEGKTVLNTNDCFMRSLEAVKRVRHLIGEVTALLTQFSYARYTGNQNEPEKRAAAAQNKLRSIALQVSVFKPAFLLPLASFIYFGHEENYYMNDQVNQVGDVFDYFEEHDSLKTVVMSCGRIWDTNKPYTQSLDAIADWDRCYEKVKSNPSLRKSKKVPWEELQKSSRGFMQRASETKELREKLQQLESLHICLSDCESTVILSCDGLKESKDNSYFEVAMSTEVLDYCLRFFWGFDTTHVNGRVQFRHNGYDKFARWARFASDINHKVKTRRIPARLLNRIRRELARYGLTRTISLQKC